jgi:hypothetical protein
VGAAAPGALYLAPPNKICVNFFSLHNEEKMKFGQDRGRNEENMSMSSFYDVHVKVRGVGRGN